MLRIGYRVSAWLARNNFLGRYEEKDDGTMPREWAQAGNNFPRGIEIEVIEEIPPKDDIEARVVIVIEKPIIHPASVFPVRGSVSIQGAVHIFDINLARELGKMLDVGPYGRAKIEDQMLARLLKPIEDCP